MLVTKDPTHTATPMHYWAVHVTDGSGATVWDGLYQAATMLDAFRWARRCWPQHAIHTTVCKKTPRQWLALLAPESRQREERRWRAAGVLGDGEVRHD